MSSDELVDAWDNEILPKLSIADLISLTQVSRALHQAVERKKFLNPLALRQRRLLKSVALDRIHYITSRKETLVLIFVRIASDLTKRGNRISIVSTKDQWGTTQDFPVQTFLADDVQLYNKYGLQNGEGWFGSWGRFSVGGDWHPPQQRNYVHCALIPRAQIEWFAIRVELPDGSSHWDNNQGWNYSLSYEEEQKRIPLYHSPNSRYLENFRRYDKTEMEGDMDGPDKPYGANIYLPTAKDWMKEVLGSHY